MVLSSWYKSFREITVIHLMNDEQRQASSLLLRIIFAAAASVYLLSFSNATAVANNI